MDERTEKYIERLEKHKEQSESRAEYAMKRLDIMLIAMAGSGIYMGLKFLENESISGKGWTIVAIVVFAGCIISNIISQWFSFYSNSLDSDWTESQIEKEKEKAEFLEDKENADTEFVYSEAEEHKKTKADLESYSKYTNGTNMTATGLLLLGMAMLLIQFISSAVCLAAHL
jgi:hypothetical protein